MDLTWVLIISSILLIFHFPLAYFATKELNMFLLWGKWRKFAWFIIVWFLPIVGAIFAQRKMGLTILSSNPSGSGNLGKAALVPGCNDGFGGGGDGGGCE